MTDCDVVISGAGPVGLFLAWELSRLGHSCILLERRSAPSTHSKALALMPKTLDLFETSGVAEPFLRNVHRVERMRLVAGSHDVIVDFRRARTRYPFVAILPQWRTEELLRAQLAARGVTIKYEHELQALRSHAHGVEATVRTPSGSVTVYARFAAGCDGIESTVRSCAGIAFPGRTYRHRALLADVEVETSVPANEARVWAGLRTLVTLFPIHGSLRRLVIVAPSELSTSYPTALWLMRRAGRAPEELRVVAAPQCSSTFSVHRRVAQALRSGNIFIAGDAAHAHSPVGGQGMNCGLHDAAVLARTLSAVLCGERSTEYLDIYERERLPAARAVVRRTDFLLRVLADPNPVLGMARVTIAPRIAALRCVRDGVARRLLTA